VQNAFDSRGTESLTYFVFDLLYLNSRDLRGVAFRERRAALEELFDEHDSERLRLAQSFDADGRSVLQSACKMGLEGVIAKRLDAPYRSGARADSWLKIKCQLRQEFVVGGFVARTGTTREIGSLLLGVYDDEGRLRSVGSVGTGWNSRTAAALLSTLESLEVTASALDPRFAPTKGRWSRRPPAVNAGCSPSRSSR